MKKDETLIGKKFRPPNREPIETVIDINTVTNMAGEVVRYEYISQYDYLNQVMTRIVPQATIIRYEVK